MTTNKQIDLSSLTINGVTKEGDLANQRGTCPHCSICLDNGVSDHCPSEGYKNEERMYACMACGGEFGPLIRKVNRTTNTGKSGKREAMSIKNWLKLNAVDGTISLVKADTYAVQTGRSPTTVRIQARALGLKTVN